MAKRKDQDFQDVSSYSRSGAKMRRKSHRGRTVLQCIAAFLCVVLILFGSALIYISTDLISDLTTTTITKDSAKLGFHEDAVIAEGITNIAVFGLDSRNSEFKGLSDVNMILTVDNTHGAVKMTSILRDSLVHIEGEGYGGGYYNENNKMNAAYVYGGPELAIRTLNQNYGLRIEKYVSINFVNMAAIVDAFGGVEMEVTADEIEEIDVNLWNLRKEVEEKQNEDQALGLYDNMTYPKVLESDFMTASADVATYLLNGNQAVSYGRIRNIGSDFARVERQQKVLMGLINRLKNFSVTDYPTLVKKLAPYCETNLAIEDILAMLPILTTNMDVERISIPDPLAETDLRDVNYDLVYNLENASKRMSAFMFEADSPYWGEYGSISAIVSPGEDAMDDVYGE